jgi:hypothetical protein
VTADLHGSCAVIAVLLPAARALLAEPGTGAVGGRVPPSSRPPWDSAAANAVMDAHEGLRRLEASLRLAVTGRTGPRRGGSDAATMAALKAIESLSNAVDLKAADQAARYVDGLCRPILELPAIDQAERWRKVPAECPYCKFTMLRVQPRAGAVTCLRYGLCHDSDGHHPIGHVYVSQLTGDPRVHWADGLVAP